MNEIKDDRKYNISHEWVLDNGDGTVYVGITDYAQELLGDIVYIELPDIGDEFTTQDTVGVVESVKAASDIFAPLTGTVVAINSKLDDAPEVVNSDPYHEGWIYALKIDSPDEMNDMLDAAAYQKECEEEET